MHIAAATNVPNNNSYVNDTVVGAGAGQPVLMVVVVLKEQKFWR